MNGSVLLLAVLLTATLSACGGQLEGSDPASRPDPKIVTVSFSRDVAPILRTCAQSCHDQLPPHLAGAARDVYSLLLIGASEHRCIRGAEQAAYVKPGAPAESFLYYKLTGESALEIWEEGHADARWDTCRDLMPANGVNLARSDPSAVDKVERWISEGAADN
ncbi:MAG: hypothetical protein IT384_03585 [Deltaproteobacteria bacterium]|nr:hypothetical protein [Deltaproteobacteria bacterium]